jgi:hypothetical protein
MYSVQGKRYIKIINFNKHQNPHKNEVAAGSEIPDITEADEVVTQAVDNKEVTINRDLSGLKRNKDGSAPAESLFLNPDSLIPLPDSLLLIPGSPSGSQAAQKKQPTETELLKNYGVDGQLAKDFLKIRKAKKAPITETALKGIYDEANKAGIYFNHAIRICIERNWQGFKADWDWKPKQPAKERPSYTLQRPETNFIDGQVINDRI